MALAPTTAAAQGSDRPVIEFTRFSTAFAPPMEFEVSTFICDRQMTANPTPPAANTSDTPGLVTAAWAANVGSMPWAAK